MAGYGDEAGFSAYAAAAGYVVPAGDIGEALQRGSDYIDAVYGARFLGTPTGGIDQPRAWPRTGVSVYGTGIADSAIPIRVVNAAYEATFLELNSPFIFSKKTVSGNGLIKRARVEGAIDVEYAVSESSDYVSGAWIISPLIDALLAPLLRPNLTGWGIEVV